MSLPSRPALLLCWAAFLLCSELASAVEVPIRVLSYDVRPTTETVSVLVPGGANPAASLYAQIHNLRYGGQVSLRVNSGPWVHLYNHTANLLEPERSQGGIGGINSTIRLAIPLSPGAVTTGASNDISFRLNGSDGITSAIRVIDFDFLDNTGTRLLTPGTLTAENPNLWTPPSTLPADIAAGANLWANAPILNDMINLAPLNATCASCHFVDGSDLKYFNYSNDSIITRSRFHGLTQQQGEQIASYIRTRVTPNPGRPWNPPFQPGPGIDPDPGDLPAVAQQKAESWMAGAGIDAVVESEAEILPHVFPEGTSPAAISKIIDHEGTFSAREVPVPIQFPDWNTWLPHFAPEDMWPTSFYYDQPYAFYNTLRAALTAPGPTTLATNGQLNSTLGKFNQDLNNWYGDFRLEDNDLLNESAVSLARSPGLTREDVVHSLVHWMTIKVMEVVREHDLENKFDNPAAMAAAGHPRYTPELLAIPGAFRLSTVFAAAPHIISDNWLNFENQPEHIGKMESNQWYHLQLCLNAGLRKVENMNVPLDWDYQLLHLHSASERTGRWYGMQRLITHIKMYQGRDNGAGIKISGFSQRTLTPWRLYSDSYRDRSLHKGALDALEPGLWRKCYEEFLYEWLDVVESMDLNDPVLVPRSFDRHELEPDTYTPIAWAGGSAKYFQHPSEVYADLMFRLLPLLPQEGIDEMLLTDLREWCKLAWPLGNWDSLFTTTNLYSENFEDGASDFNVTSAVLAATAIKDANYVNTYPIGPKNGGGKFVGSRGLTAPVSPALSTTRQGINDTINVALAGTTRLKLKARVAFRDSDTIDPGIVRFRMRLQFDGGPTTYDAEDTLTLDPDLYDTEFETYLSHLDIPSGATDVTWLALWWERVGGTGGGTVYVDNIHLLPVDETLDTTAPAAPVLASVTANANLRLRPNWTNTNLPGDGVIGYNVYRRIDGTPLNMAVKLNTGPVDNPYIFYEDYTAQRGLTYRYHLTALDAAGNESAPSNEKTKILPDIDTPLTPSTIWAVQTPGNLDFSWFGIRTWDIAGFDVYRKAAGEPAFTMLTTPLMAEETLSFSDPTAIDGITYDYYVESFDLLGNLSPSSATLSVLSTTGITHVDVWSLGFNGTNGWDSSNPLISGDGIDYDLDGVATLWEYLQGKNPALADSEVMSFPDGDVVEDGPNRFLELTYRRLEDLPPGLVVKVQCSDNLTSWPVEYVVEGAIPDPEITVSEGTPSGGMRTITVRLNTPIGDPGSRPFARLLLEEH